MLITLNVKKFKLNELNNFETIKTKKIIIKKIMKKKLRYKKHQTKFNLNSKKSRKTKKWRNLKKRENQSKKTILRLRL